MREYYRHARDIHRCAKQQMEASEQISEGGLTQQFREWRSRLSNADFTVSRDRVFFRSPQQIASDPALVLRLFEFVARHGIRLSLEAERRVRDHKLYLEEYFASSRPLWPSLEAILLLPHARLALRAMHETGLLQIIIPVWEQIECLVVRDFYHRYTVDEHTLVTLEYLEELQATKDAGRRRFRELLEETTRSAAPVHGAALPRPGKERRAGRTRHRLGQSCRARPGTHADARDQSGAQCYS